MALPTKKKRGIRLLKHEGRAYYWKVKNDYAKAELEVLIGLESKPGICFHVRVSFVDPVLYGPWLAASQMQGKEAIEVNNPEHISPKFIVEAIAFANTAAALKCTVFGGRLGAPTREEVRAALHEKGNT